MNSSNKSDLPKRSLKPIVVALALALPGSAAVAASMDDVVETRADQNIDQQFGRDSVYGFSAEDKPLSPEDTSGAQRNDSESDDVSWMQSPDTSESTGYSGPSGNELSFNADQSAALDSGFYVGSGYTSNEQMSSDQLAVVPLEIEMTPGSVAWYDGTEKEYERGYYDDPDVEPAGPNDTWLQDDATASSEDQSLSAGID